MKITVEVFKLYKARSDSWAIIKYKCKTSIQQLGNCSSLQGISIRPSKSVSTSWPCSRVFKTIFRHDFGGKWRSHGCLRWIFKSGHWAHPHLLPDQTPSPREYFFYNSEESDNDAGSQSSGSKKQKSRKGSMKVIIPKKNIQKMPAGMGRVWSF